MKTAIHVTQAATERDGIWYAGGAPYQRLRLFSPGSIAGFGLAVCVGLALGFPHKSLEERLATSEQHRKADRLTVEYLKVFLDAEPQEHSLRIRLVRQLIQLDSFAEARIALLPLARSSNPSLRHEADWFELQMLEQEAFSQSGDAPRHAERLDMVRRQFRRLLPDIPDSSRLLLLAQKALAIEDHELAGAAFQRLVASGDRIDVARYVQAARLALSLKDYRTSAGLYLRAMEQSSMRDLRRQFFLEALRTYQAGGLAADAIAAADRHLGMLGDDRETLIFIARLAQAANMPEAAERYALRLLKLSLLMRMDRPILMHAALPYDRMAGGMMRINAAAPQGKSPGLPFDDEAYTLGYNIFIANRNLADARRVAESAVRQQPDSPAWRKRLAEVSEWSNAPADALPHWFAYARMTGDKVAWDNVLRIGESVNDTEAVLAAVRYKITAEPNNPEWLGQLLSAYENAGEPERALQLLQERLSGNTERLAREERRRELALLAELAERMGRDDDALDAWRRLHREFGPKGAYALHIAEHLDQRGKTREAYAVLKNAASAAGADEVDFWRTFAELARTFQETDTAKSGYRRLLQANAESEADLFNLVSLLDGDQPLAAARAAMYAFHRTGNRRFALLALSASDRAGDTAGARGFLQSIPVQTLAALQQDPQFLASRSMILQSGGDLAGAERDMRAALALRPADSGYRAGLIWILIARRDRESLMKVLSAWASDAENDPALWGPYAAASMSINRQRDALHWFRKSGFPQDDYLWLMSYAEALDATSQPELAWRIRRRAWFDLRKPEVLKQTSPDNLVALRDRLASLAPLFMNGDGAAAVMQALLRADVRALADIPQVDAPRNGKELLAHLERVGEAVAKNPPSGATPASADAMFVPSGGERPRDDLRMSATVRELALGYALNREAHDLARAWLASRYAEQLSRPLWGELSLLLATDDRERLGRLLDDMPDWLPMYDRIEAAQRAGRHGLAETMAFDQMVHLPHDEEFHLRFTTMAATRRPGAHVRLNDLRQWPLRRTDLRTRFHTDLTPHLKLSLELGQARQESRNAAELVNVPRSDRVIDARLRMDVGDGTLTASVHHRTAVHATTGLRLAYALPLGNGLDLTADAGIRQPATESALLRVGGMRSGMDMALTYALGKAEYLRAALGWQRYATQAGTHLGSGFNWTLETGAHLRIEYPNLTLRASVSGGSYTASGNVDSQILRLLPQEADLATYRFVPQGDTMLGLSLGIGTVADGRYTRAWRPFADLGLTWSRAGGTGFNFSGGMAASVFGQDTLQIRATRSAGTPASPNGYREIGLDYLWLY